MGREKKAIKTSAKLRREINKLNKLMLSSLNDNHIDIGTEKQIAHHKIVIENYHNTIVKLIPKNTDVYEYIYSNTVTLSKNEYDQLKKPEKKTSSPVVKQKTYAQKLFKQTRTITLTNAFKEFVD